MMQCSKSRSGRKAWIVLLGCCLLQGGSLGLVQNSMGVFFSAVSADLGFSLGGISLYRTICGLSSCLLLPFVPHKYQRIFCTFMYNYNLLGAVMVFVDPSGLMHPYWTLTLHGFIWHILLIFIGLLIAFSRMVLPTAKGFWQSTAVFAVGCVIATIINVTSHPYGNADMFYITPYYATTQIVYSQIAAKFGIFAGNTVYVLSIILGAWLLHLVFQVERP